MPVSLSSTRLNNSAGSGGARWRVLAATVTRPATGAFLAAVLVVALAPALGPALAQADASKPEASASKPDASTAPAGVKPPEASSGDIDGETMFATLCGFCHESGGRTEGKGPKLANSKRSDEYLIDRIKKGKPGAMPAFGRVFSDGQITAILAYIRGLDE